MTERLEQVLADEREQANILRLNGHGQDAALKERLLDRVAAAAEEYLTWLSEDDARLRSGKSAAWLRARFPLWETSGHARYHGRKRQYLMIVVPQRVHPSAAREQGRRAGQKAA